MTDLFTTNLFLLTIMIMVACGVLIISSQIDKIDKIVSQLKRIADSKEKS